MGFTTLCPDLFAQLAQDEGPSIDHSTTVYVSSDPVAVADPTRRPPFLLDLSLDLDSPAGLPPFDLPETPSLPSSHPDVPALDVFKLACAHYIANTLDVPLDKAYEGVESGKTGKNVLGDFVVAVPRFRLKEKPNVVADKLVNSVNPALSILPLPCVCTDLDPLSTVQTDTVPQFGQVGGSVRLVQR